jgi:hypothetical protein
VPLYAGGAGELFVIELIALLSVGNDIVLGPVIGSVAPNVAELAPGSDTSRAGAGELW